jgi:cytochrome P450
VYESMLAHTNPVDMVNDTLRRFARVGVAPAPIQQSPLDWAANYTMQARQVSWTEARRIVADVLERKRAGKLLPDADERVWEAFDRVAQESR